MLVKMMQWMNLRVLEGKWKKTDITIPIPKTFPTITSSIMLLC